jgi:uncharacterized protein
MNTATDLPSSAAPVQLWERIEILDVLRGFALFGILVVNMEMFAHPVQGIVVPLFQDAPLYDRIATWLVRFLAEGKFYSLFSLLFGLGFALHLTRAKERGFGFGGTYLRRLAVLLAIGLVHAFLIWVGDILSLYAVLGFLLILFRNVRPKRLVVAAVLSLSLPMLLFSLAGLLVALGSMAGPDAAAEMDRGFAEQEAAFRADAVQAYQVYPNAGFLEITRQRAQDMGFIAYGYFFLLPSVFAMFLAGLYLGKRRVFQDLSGNRPLFKKLMWWGLAFGLAGNFLYATLIPGLSRVRPTGQLLLASLGQTVGAPALALFYLAAITLIFTTPVWASRLRRLAPVGRMALSNYLMQSVICTLIFYGYGLGLYGQLGKAAGLGLAVVIFLIQIPLSHWWLNRYRFGPAEWLWRSVTYMRLQPMALVSDQRQAIYGQR